ncbi:unnamed protein product [Arctogadus glacialis]
MDIVAHCSSSLMANTAFSEGYERQKDNVKMAYDLSPYLLIVKCSYHPCQYPIDSAVVELPPDTTYLGVIQNALIYRGTEEGTEQDSLRLEGMSSLKEEGNRGKNIATQQRRREVDKAAWQDKGLHL